METILNLTLSQWSSVLFVGLCVWASRQLYKYARGCRERKRNKDYTNVLGLILGVTMVFVGQIVAFIADGGPVMQWLRIELKFGAMILIFFAVRLAKSRCSTA